MVAHADHLGRRHDVETLGGTTLGVEYRADLRLVAEEHDPALRCDLRQRHDCALDRSFGREIAAHGVNTNL